MNKKGQIAIFVIIAIVIVAAVLAIVLYPRLTLTVAPAVASPNAFLKGCIEPGIKENVALLGANAGYQNVTGYVMYNGEKVKYLCYTNKYYDTCVVQQPLIVGNFENELKNLIAAKLAVCAENLKTDYKNRGYTVTAGAASSTVSMIPGKIKIDMVLPLTVTKGETIQKLPDIYSIMIDSQMYDLAMIATSIVDFESKLGNSETSLYLQYYPNIKIEKDYTDDSSKVYKISDVVTKESFIFASRSIVWPAGYTGT